MSLIAGSASENQEPIPVNTRSLLSIRQAFDVAFGRSSDNPHFQRMINEFPFHQVMQPGKAQLMTFFMLEALAMPEHEKRSVYEQIQETFHEILRRQKFAREILKHAPAEVRPADAPPVTPDEHERQTAKHIVDTASVLSAIMPPESTYEDLRAIMLPLVQSFKEALRQNGSTLCEVLEADFTQAPAAAPTLELVG